MPSEQKSFYNQLNTFVENKVIPEVNQDLKVLNSKKVGMLCFILIQTKDQPNSPKYIVGYEIEMVGENEGDIQFSAKKIGDSLSQWGELVTCPNPLLARIERNIGEHRKFVDACLKKQDEIKREIKVRSQKFSLLEELGEGTILTHSSGRAVQVLRLNKSRKDLRCEVISTGEKQTYSLDDFDIEEIKYCIKKNQKVRA